jgi:hypothetical protein
MNKEPIAICENKNSERVIKFIDLDKFNKEFQKSYNNATVSGCYYDENGNIVSKDIWDTVHTDIFKSVKELQIETAANHFTELYAEEIAEDEVTGDTIHEWWGQTVDQYSELESSDFELIKEAINEKI